MPQLFLRYLLEANIKVLVDVRASPRGWSPFYSKPHIEKWLAEHNIEYFWARYLGNPQGLPPEQYRMNGLSYNNLLSILVGCREADVNVALMCAELDHNRCHRSAITRVFEHQFEVEHL